MRAALDRLEELRRQHRLEAPRAGVVEKVNLTTGEFVERGRPVLRLRSQEFLVKILLPVPELKPEWQSALRFRLAGGGGSLEPAWESLHALGPSVWVLHLRADSVLRGSTRSAQVEISTTSQEPNHEEPILSHLVELFRPY